VKSTLKAFQIKAQGRAALPFKGFCTLQRALPCPRLQPVGIRFSFSAGYSALRRGFPTCFSLAFVPSFYEEKNAIETAYQEARADRRKVILMEDEAGFYRQPTARWN